VFESALDPEATATLIESALVDRGLRNAAVMVRSQAELAELLSNDHFAPYPSEQFTRFVTFFRSDLPEGAVAGSEDPSILVLKRELLAAVPVVRPQGLDVNGGWEKKLKIQGTTRYWRVVQEIARRLED
jgi:uncharacterized protein (DUF1697 family)